MYFVAICLLQSYFIYDYIYEYDYEFYMCASMENSLQLGLMATFRTVLLCPAEFESGPHDAKQLLYKLGA